MSEKETTDTNPGMGMDGEKSAGPQQTMIVEIDKQSKVQGGTMILQGITIDCPSLVGISSPYTGKIFEIIQSEITIGRGPGNNIVLDDPAVSVEHAKIKYDNDSWQIVDLGAVNGTFVNGKTTVSRFLSSGDVIKIGPIELRFAVDNRQANSFIDSLPLTGSGKSRKKSSPIGLYIAIGFVLALIIGGAWLFLDKM